MSEFRKVITKPGEVIDFETVYEENPYIRTGVPSKPGKCERLEYTTSVYEDGKTYHKYCYVYLPYGYDPEDKSKKYNVLYFQHGNTCDPQMFSVGGNKPMIDMLFESGEIEPCIIAFITYYMDPEGDYKERVISGMVPAGDGYWADIKGNPDLPFFIFASCGNPDAEEMKIQMKYITKIDGFSYGKDTTKNNIYFALSDYYHTDFLVPYYYWNSLKVLFKGV